MAANTNALIDTGAMLALLDSRDRWHSICKETFYSLQLPLLTSQAVLTELFHLVGSRRRDMEAAWNFVRSGAIVSGTITDSELSHPHSLMFKYADTPMDFADATLVYLAGRERISTVFTIDQSDFETYRMPGNRRFRIVPRRERAST